jgi:DNA-binding transcriptional LysR family regulator
MRLDWLRSFLAFGETLNFTRAAKRLHLSQPALHEQVRQLGEHLRVTLYVREGRALRLTDEGRRTHVLARDLLQRATEFERDVRGEEHLGPLVVCAGRGTHLNLLAHHLRSWGEPLELMIADRDGALEAVLSGRAHVGVAPLESLPKGLWTEVLASVGQLAVVAEDHPLACRARLRLEELDGATLVLPPQGRPHRVAVIRALAAAGARVEVAVEAADWDLMMLHASLGSGIAIVNDHCVPPPGARGIPLTAFPKLDYHVFLREGAPGADRALALARHLRGRRRR